MPSRTDLELAIFDGSLDVVPTITLFKRAIMIIGPHGAGFTNLLWAREGTKIVEFLHMTYPLLCYWHMASGTPADLFYMRTAFSVFWPFSTGI